jgi:hypothetical protein
VISDERAEFIAALSKAADMVKLLLRQIDLLISGYESGASADRRWTQAASRASAIWRRDLERLRQRLASVMIERRRDHNDAKLRLVGPREAAAAAWIDRDSASRARLHAVEGSARGDAGDAHRAWHRAGADLLDQR